MVDPSLTLSGRGPELTDKQTLRRQLRDRRAEYVAALPDVTRALLFLRPPGPLEALLPAGSVVGLYHANRNEAPTLRYARWLHENGRQLALPCFDNRDAPMAFRVWADPYEDNALLTGPYGIMQPGEDAPAVVPDVLIVPLIGFTAHGDRLGQGGGHYDRWLADHPSVPAIGLGWDCQLTESLPVEAHDRPLRAVVTPTRYYEGRTDA